MVRRIKSGVYIHQQPEWPEFRWDSERISLRLAGVRHRQGRPIGRMEGLGLQLRELTSSKWASLEKCSQDTALRGIEDLVRKGVLTKDSAGGRSTSYSLAKLR